MARRESNGEAIRALRKSLGVKQPEFALAVGIGQPYLSMIESGRRKATPHVIRAIADQLGVSVLAITNVVTDEDAGVPA